jgi:hypothetical protein
VAHLELEREEHSLLVPYADTEIAGAVGGEGERGYVDELGHGEGKALEQGDRRLDDVELAIVVCGVDVVVLVVWTRGPRVGGTEAGKVGDMDHRVLVMAQSWLKKIAGKAII